ncbi:MAG: LuxR C-terminal-related transcriptional regulator [Pseudomonadota bacterium]
MMQAILIVDDLVAARALLDRAARLAFPDCRPTHASSVAEAQAAIQTARFDLALIDLGLGDGDGIEVLRCLSTLQPECIGVVATILDDDGHVFDALRAGAQGYLLKDHPEAWLATQMRGIRDGQPPLSPSIARRLIGHFAQAQADSAGSVSLSPRETEVLARLAQGERLADIAEALELSRHTVGDHVKNIYRKLNIRSRAEAALKARAMGLA